MIDTIQHYEHEQFHNWYQQQKRKDGSSCCNNKDCRPAYDWEMVPGGVRMKIDAGWVFVPMSKVQAKTPDGRAHYCGIMHPSNGTQVIFCGFIPLSV